MDVRLVGVPMIDRHPVDLAAEVPLDASHQVAGEGAQVGHLGRVLRRDDEAEMVAVALTALGEAGGIRLVSARVKHAWVCPVAGHAIALEIVEVGSVKNLGR